MNNEQKTCPLTTNANVSATPCCWFTQVIYPTKIAPKNPPSQVYHGITVAGFKLITAEVFVIKFRTNKQINPTVKLSNEPINGPPVCFPSRVFKIACIGSSAPVRNVRNIRKYRIEKSLAVSQFVNL